MKTYDTNYRNNACDLMVMGGKSANEVHHELGVSVTTLLKWKKRYLAGAGSVQVNGKIKTATEMDVELRDIRKQLIQVKWERDILKKAASILASEPRSNMR